MSEYTDTIINAINMGINYDFILNLKSSMTILKMFQIGIRNIKHYIRKKT